MKEVIVTDTHSRMSLAVVRELGNAGFAVTSVTKESLPSLGHKSKYTSKSITLPDEGYADALLELARGKHPVLLPVGAQTINIAAKRRDEFISSFQMLLPEFDALEAASDKPQVAQAAEAVGLSVPRDYSIETPEFPCVVKFRNGEALGLRAHERYKIVRDVDSFDNAIKEMGKIGEFFVSQYIYGDGIGVSAVLDNNHNPVNVFCHRRIREYPISGGPSTCAESVWPPKLVEGAIRLLKKMKLSGFAMVEFKGTFDKAYVLEINPRIWGTFPLGRHCGAGMALSYVMAAMGKHDICDYSECGYNTGIRMQFLANDILCLKSRVLSNSKYKGSVISDFLSPRVYGGVFDFKDLPGSIAYIRSLTRRVF